MSEAVAGRVNAYNKAKDIKNYYKTYQEIFMVKKNIDKKTKSIMVEYF